MCKECVGYTHLEQTEETQAQHPLYLQNFLLKNFKCLKNSKVAKKSKGVDKKSRATCRETLVFVC